MPDIDDLVKQAIEEMPGVSSSAEKISEGEKKDEPSNIDTGGSVSFNPEIHCVDESGNPRLNKDGSYRLRPGRKGSVQSSKTDGSMEACMHAGKATAEAIFAIGIAIGGDEWRPVVDKSKNINEPEFMSTAWAQYYHATGVTNVPPWLMVAVACGSYALPRIRLPETQSRLKIFIGKLMGFFKRKKNETGN